MGWTQHSRTSYPTRTSGSSSPVGHRSHLCGLTVTGTASDGNTGDNGQHGFAFSGGRAHGDGGFSHGDREAHGGDGSHHDFHHGRGYGARTFDQTRSFLGGDTDCERSLSYRDGLGDGARSNYYRDEQYFTPRTLASRHGADVLDRSFRHGERMGDGDGTRDFDFRHRLDEFHGHGAAFDHDSTRELPPPPPPRPRWGEGARPSLFPRPSATITREQPSTDFETDGFTASRKRPRQDDDSDSDSRTPSEVGSSVPADPDQLKLHEILLASRPQDFSAKKIRLTSDVADQLGSLGSSQVRLTSSQQLSAAFVLANDRLAHPSASWEQLLEPESVAAERVSPKDRVSCYSFRLPVKVAPNLIPCQKSSQLSQHEFSALGLDAKKLRSSVHVKHHAFANLEKLLHSSLAMQACSSAVFSSLVSLLGAVPKDSKDKGPEAFRFYSDIDSASAGILLESLSKSLQDVLDITAHQRAQLVGLFRDHVLSLSKKLDSDSGAALRNLPLQFSSTFDSQVLDAALSTAKEDRQDSTNRKMMELIASQKKASQHKDSRSSSYKQRSFFRGNRDNRSFRPYNRFRGRGRGFDRQKDNKSNQQQQQSSRGRAGPLF